MVNKIVFIIFLILSVNSYAGTECSDSDAYCLLIEDITYNSYVKFRDGTHTANTPSKYDDLAFEYALSIKKKIDNYRSDFSSETPSYRQERLDNLYNHADALESHVRESRRLQLETYKQLADSAIDGATSNSETEFWSKMAVNLFDGAIHENRVNEMTSKINKEIQGIKDAVLSIAMEFE